MRLKRVSDIKPGEVPFSKKTLYMWSHRKKHPELFIRIGGRALFVDLDALDRWLEANRMSRTGELPGAESPRDKEAKNATRIDGARPDRRAQAHKATPGGET